MGQLALEISEAKSWHLWRQHYKNNKLYKPKEIVSLCLIPSGLRMVLIN